MTDLKANVTAANTKIHTDMLHTILQELHYRLDICLQQNEHISNKSEEYIQNFIIIPLHVSTF